MLFVLTNAPAVFQMLINNVLCDFLYIFVFVYLDDILIYFSIEDEHIKHVKAILQCLGEN